jgi:NAD(P)H dehydrogenase (quinone)
MGSSKVLVVFYSMYGHNLAMAKAVVEGAQAAGAQADLRRIPETLPVEVLEKMHAVEAQKAFASVPLASIEDLASYDAIIVASPTRFGSVPAQVQAFFDQTGQLWFGGKLVGKIGSALVSSASQHGGQETTFGGIHNFFLHHGMAIVGLPYAFQGQMGLDEIKGGSPYGATTITGGQGERLPSAVELEAARYQGKHVATLAAKLAQK